MKRTFTKLFGLALILVFGFVLMTNASSAATKRVLLEQHTGAWCGWCVDGTVIMDQIIEKYPDQVIGVKIHNGDAMAITEQGEIGNALGLTGYPTGSVDRIAFNVGGTPAIFLSRTVWMQAVESVIQQQVTPAVDIKVNWAYNAGTGTIDAEISGEVLIALEGKYNVNIYIIEDNVTGSGSGYDQSNYLSGRAGYENNPYYNQPAKIVGYHHMKVVRDMMGGSWGTEGVIPDNAAVGTKFSKKYSFPADGSWNMDEVHLVGLVQAASENNRSIANAVIGEQGMPNTEVTMSGDALEVVAFGNSMERDFAVYNRSEAALTVNIEASVSNRTPADWETSITTDLGKIEMKGNNKLQGTEVTIQPDEFVPVTATLTPGSTIGAGDLTITVTEVNDPSAIASAASMTAISKEIPRIEILIGTNSTFSYGNTFAASDYSDVFTMDNDLYTLIGEELTQLKTIIVNTGQKGGLESADANEIIKFLDEGKNVLLAGGVALPMLSFESATHPIFQKLGVGWATGNDIQNVSTFSLMGVPDNPITDGLYYSCGTVAGGFWMQKLNILNSSIANTMFTLNSLPVAVNGELENARFAVFSFYPGIFKQASDETAVINKTIKWLEGANTPEPELTLDKQSVDFGEVLVGEKETADINISNTGEADLIITDIVISGLEPEAFEIIAGGISEGPITIAPKGNHTITIEFTPETAEYTYYADVEIVSNNVITTVTVPLEGTGEVTGVSDNATANLSMSAGPNPFNSEATVTLQLSGDIARDINLFVVDQNGRYVTELANRTFAPGMHTVKFNAENYASGTYFIQAVINGQMTQLPVVLVK